MHRIERVLCPMDFSETSGFAYDYARSIARHFDSPLYLEHVIEPFSSVYNYYPLFESWDDVRAKEAQEHLRTFIVNHPHEGRPPEAVVQEGPVPESILEFAKEHNVSLIVMGPHGHRTMDRIVPRSVTEAVMRKSACPVLAVRKPAHSPTPRAVEENGINLKRIVFCTDFSEASAQAVDYAISLAMEFSSDLTLLHVVESLPPGVELSEIEERVERKIREFIPRGIEDWCSVRTAVRIGKPYQEIIQLALETEADLIVMGVRGRNALDLAVFGSTTHRVIQIGPCPVLAVHGMSGQQQAENEELRKEETP